MQPRTSPPYLWKRRSLFQLGIRVSASQVDEQVPDDPLTSAARAQVGLHTWAVSRIARLQSAAFGALSESLHRKSDTAPAQ